MGRMGFGRAEAAGRETRAAPSDALPVEIAGMADRLDRQTLEQATRRARLLGTGADEVLLSAGRASPDALTQGVARHLCIDFLQLEPEVGGDAQVQGPSLRFAGIVGLLRTGVARLPDGGLLLATRGRALHALAEKLNQRPELARVVRLTTPERVARYMRLRFAKELAEQAAFRLSRSWPALSAHALGLSRYVLAAIAMMLASLPFILHQLPPFFMLAIAVPMVALVLGWSAYRLTACTNVPLRDPPPLRDDAALPLYSLLVPLYREARVVPQLVDALKALDYPREKLQILMVVELDDRETAAALARYAAGPGFEVITAPQLGPRTKPKALNAALAFARGEIIGVFDAEDIPDTQQLRRVCGALWRGGATLGCVQARLAIDNLCDSWITRQFAAEYAAHFDVVLPMLANYGLPLPLGGTSNHFRREALERIGGWDPFNVTEDADLGLRLARQGWRTTMIASTTDEEAPKSAHAWLRQRSRWYKGWMQTLLVHARHPRQLARQAGLGGTITLAIMFGGNLVARKIAWPFAKDQMATLEGCLNALKCAFHGPLIRHARRTDR